MPVATIRPKGSNIQIPLGLAGTGANAANNTGKNTSSNPVNVELYYLHADHLGTPRMATRSQAINGATSGPNAINKAVWRWDSDPFGTSLGNSKPNENPQNVTGTASKITAASFRVNNRFPGQIADAESWKYYNYFRDYDAAIGRYVESDPIGLRGGLSTFGYVKQQPNRLRDPDGLKVQECCRRAEILGGRTGVKHCWLKTDSITAGMASNPACRAGVGDNYEAPWITPVFVSDHSCEKDGDCNDVPWDVDEDCVNRKLKIGTYLGQFGLMNNCQTFANSVLNECSKTAPFRPPPKPKESKPCCGK
ncbi:MAG: RHS repeat-associated core domain-containing protein [Burkholderiales bacterium]|nr:RHS repeat-associated core domain-containing protein [Burkholderiales bacterium]